MPDDRRIRGWWSDQLQNNDDTLVAGQQNSYAVSVGRQEQLPWIDLKDITGGQAVKATSNMYVCEFNPKRIQVLPLTDAHLCKR